jgi:hypothetical protein
MMLAGAARAAIGQEIQVGPNVQVSAPLADRPHFETILAADPADANRLMACSMLTPSDEPSAQVVTYNSFDGGGTWKLTLHVRGEQESWDPDCVYGPDGVAYSVSEILDSARGLYVSPEAEPYIRIDRSADGGRTWTSSRRVPHFERAFLTIDRTAGPRRGWLYLHGQGGSPTMGGARPYVGGLEMHILPPDGGIRTLTRLSGDDSYVINAGPGVVLSDGTFVGIFGEIRNYWGPGGEGRVPPNLLGRSGDAQANAWLKVARLKPGTRRPDIATVGDYFSPWADDIWSSSTIPSLAVDASDGPFKDRLYVAWSDLRSGRSEIFLCYSADGGESWSAPRVVNDDRARLVPRKGPHHLMPVVTVNRTGVVGVMWYDRRERPDELGWDVRFSASLDGGESFLPSVKVSERPHRPASGKRWPLQGLTWPATPASPAVSRIGLHHFDLTGGHTAGHAADARGTFHPLWVSNATGTAQLWTAPVRVEGSAIRHGDSTLARLTDVSRSIQLQFNNPVYDSEKKLLEVDLTLRNGASDTLISGPISVRLLDLRSELGAVTLLTADNGRLGPGAIWRFGDEIPGDLLRPGQTSRPRRIRFRVTDLDPLRTSFDPIVSLVQTSTRAFARVVTPSPSASAPPQR